METLVSILFAILFLMLAIFMISGFITLVCYGLNDWYNVELAAKIGTITTKIMFISGGIALVVFVVCGSYALIKLSIITLLGI